MNRRIVLVPVAAVLLAMAGLLWAQGSDSAGEPNNPGASDTAAPSPSEGEDGSSADTSGTGSAPSGGASESRDSPFDYEASEQISEDLSVSFPVDI
jgi:hypothetical protein